MNKEPDNRILACLFAPTIFALIWTTSHNTTRKWIVISSIPFLLLGLFILVLGGELRPIIGEYMNLFLRHAIVIGILISSIVTIPIRMYFMYKWVTAYNLKTYGYKSKSAFRKAQYNNQD